MAKFDLRLTIHFKGDMDYIDTQNIADMEEALNELIDDVIPEEEPIKYKAKLENLITGIVIEKSN